MGNALISHIKKEKLDFSKSDSKIVASVQNDFFSASLKEEKATQALYEEVKSNLSAKDLLAFSRSVKEPHAIDESLLRKLPTVRVRSMSNSSAVSTLSKSVSNIVSQNYRLIDQAISTKASDAGDEASRIILRASSKALYMGLQMLTNSSKATARILPKINLSERL